MCLQSSACQKTRAIAAWSVVLLICPICGHRTVVHPDCRLGTCRHLLDSSAQPVFQSFVDWLGPETAAEHILELYDGVQASETFSGWLVESTRSPLSSPAGGSDGEHTDAHSGDEHAEHADHDDHGDHAAHTEPDASGQATPGVASGGTEHQDAHDHDHDHESRRRRLLLQTAAPSEAAHDDHAGHAHGDHDGHGHGDHADHADHEAHAAGAAAEEPAHDRAAHGGGAATWLSLAELHGMMNSTQPLPSADDVSTLLLYITACRIDDSCLVEGDAAAAADRGAHAADTLEGHASHDEHGGHAGHEGHDHGAHDGDPSDLLGLKVGLAFAFLGMSIVASYLPLLFRLSAHYSGILACINAFSGSVFLTVGLIHLVPHVLEFQEAAMPGTSFPVGLALVVVGFALILFVEQVLFDVHGSSSRDAPEAPKDGSLLDHTARVAYRYHDPLITEAAVVVHGVLECIVLGLAPTTRDTLILFGAITSHKVFGAMSLSTRFLRLGCSPLLLLLLLSPFHLLPPLATILGAVVGSDNAAVSLVLSALATGTFIYIGAFEVVCEEFAEEDHEAAAAANGKDAELGDAKRGGAKGADPQKAEALSEGLAAGAVVSVRAGVEGEESMVEWGPRNGAGGVSGGDAAMEKQKGLAGRQQRRQFRPTKAIKFAMFVLGIGALFVVTALLPEHNHAH